MNRLLIATVLAALGAAAYASAVSTTINVMSVDNSDYGWQVNVPANGVVDWRWEDATSATVTIVSVMTGETVSSTVVTKSGSEVSGSVTLPAASETVDQLFDFTVALSNDETLTARVARPAEKRTILSETPARGWTRVIGGEPRLFAYAADWFDGAADATAVSVSVAGTATALPSVCGFGAVKGVRTASDGSFAFSLAFDSQAEFSTSLWLSGGLVILLR